MSAPRRQPARQRSTQGLREDDSVRTSRRWDAGAGAAATGAEDGAGAGATVAWAGAGIGALRAGAFGRIDGCGLGAGAGAGIQAETGWRTIGAGTEGWAFATEGGVETAGGR